MALFLRVSLAGMHVVLSVTPQFRYGRGVSLMAVSANRPQAPRCQSSGERRKQYAR